MFFVLDPKPLELLEESSVDLTPDKLRSKDGCIWTVQMVQLASRNGLEINTNGDLTDPGAQPWFVVLFECVTRDCSRHHAFQVATNLDEYYLARQSLRPSSMPKFPFTDVCRNLISRKITEYLENIKC